MATVHGEDIKLANQTSYFDNSTRGAKIKSQELLDCQEMGRARLDHQGLQAYLKKLEQRENRVMIFRVDGRVAVTITFKARYSSKNNCMEVLELLFSEEGSSFA